MMKTKNTDEPLRIFNTLSMMRKGLNVFLVFFVQQMIAQVVIGNKAEMHIIEGTILYDENAESQNLVLNEKIFVNAGTQIYQENSQENNFRVVNIERAKKNIAAKTSKTKTNKKTSIPAESAKPKFAKNQQLKQETFSELPPSGTNFSVHKLHSFVVAHTQNISVKHFLVPQYSDLEISVLVLSKAKIAAYFSYWNSKIYLNSSSIRPPPSHS